MSEVLIVLTLRRRSGVLAAAVASVHRAGLEFRSQRMLEAEGAFQLHLSCEGEVASLEDLMATMTGVSGVSEVADVLVDGDSLVHLPPEPESEPEPEPELEIEAEEFDESVAAFGAQSMLEDPWSEPNEAPAPEPQRGEPVAATPEPERIPEPQPEPEPEPETKPEPKPELKLAEANESEDKLADFATVSESSQAPQAEKPSADNKDQPTTGRKMTPGMIRRMRRRR
jgi:outer membrane biosynthesis protein TonB